MTRVSQAALVDGAIAGKVVSFPTNTVPALAVLPQHAALIFALKKRPLDKPLILMGASGAELWSYVSGTAAELKVWQQAAARYWPGPVTFVLPASSKVPVAMNPHDRATIGVRVPSHKIAQAILAQTGPLATTSANLSGVDPLEMSEVEAVFPDILTLECYQLDSGKLGSGLPSTVAKWTGNQWEILRRGIITDIRIDQ